MLFFWYSRFPFGRLSHGMESITSFILPPRRGSRGFLVMTGGEGRLMGPAENWISDCTTRRSPCASWLRRDEPE